MGGIVDSIFGGGQSTPDPYAVASAQGAANVDAARVTAALNRANQYTPYGNLTWQRGGQNWDQSGYQKALDNYNTQLTNYNTANTNAQNNGIFGIGQSVGAAPVAPKQEDYGYNPDAWSSTVQLDPRVQSLLDSSLSGSQRLADMSNSVLSNIGSNFSAGLNTNNLTQRQSVADALNVARGGLADPSQLYSNAQSYINSTATPAGQASGNFSHQLTSAMPQVERVADIPNYQQMQGGVPTSDSDYRKQIQDALYSQQTSRLDPRFSQDESNLQSSLAAQGITQGSEAYNREVQNFGRTKNDAYQQAMNNAISGGEAAIQGQYGRDLSGRQQGVTENNLTFQNNLAGRSQDLNAANQYFTQGLAQRQQGMNEFNSAMQNYGSALQNQQSAAGQGANIAAMTPQIASSYYGLNSNARGSELAEQIQQRNQALNELNALRTGSQVTMPQFGSTQSGAQVASSPVAQSVYNSAGMQNASSNAMMGGLTNLGAAAMMAPTGTFASLAAMF